MANNGFNAATDIFNLGNKWAVKSASKNASVSTAECPNIFNDVAARDAFGNRIAPSAEYDLAGDVTSLPALGTVVTIDTKKVMLTQIVVRTSRGAAPSAIVSGVEVEAGATTGRTYSCGTIALTTRHRAQDILGLYGATVPDTLTEANFTFSIEPSVNDPKGVITSSDCGGGKVVAQYTHTTATTAAVSAPTVTGNTKVVSEPVTDDKAENDYITVRCSVTDSLTGAEPAS